MAHDYKPSYPPRYGDDRPARGSALTPDRSWLLADAEVTAESSSRRVYLAKTVLHDVIDCVARFRRAAPGTMSASINRRYRVGLGYGIVRLACGFSGLV